MDKQILVQRMMELRTQLADISRRLEDMDSIFDDGVTDEAVKKYAEELKRIMAEREPILKEIRSLLLLVDEKAPGIGDGGAMVN